MKSADCAIPGYNELIPVIKSGAIVVRLMQIGKVTIRVNSHFDGQESLFDLLLASAREQISKNPSSKTPKQRSDMRNHKHILSRHA